LTGYGLERSKLDSAYPSALLMSLPRMGRCGGRLGEENNFEELNFPTSTWRKSHGRDGIVEKGGDYIQILDRANKQKSEMVVWRMRNA
jgi:hypothetical protein